jgi:heme oxygenase
MALVDTEIHDDGVRENLQKAKKYISDKIFSIKLSIIEIRTRLDWIRQDLEDIGHAGGKIQEAEMLLSEIESKIEDLEEARRKL